MINLFHHQSAPVIKQYFLLNEQEQYFFIDWDEIDWEWYSLKILLCSFERDVISQKLNLTHACNAM
jgi:hypothetical protein